MQHAKHVFTVRAKSKPYVNAVGMQNCSLSHLYLRDTELGDWDQGDRACGDMLCGWCTVYLFPVLIFVILLAALHDRTLHLDYVIAVQNVLAILPNIFVSSITGGLTTLVVNLFFSCHLFGRFTFCALGTLLCWRCYFNFRQWCKI